MVKKTKFNWAVFNIETKLRLTEYTTRERAEWARGLILYDQPELRGEIVIKQKGFESR